MQTMTHTQTILPPDFLHGASVLEDLYGAFGETWVENAVFVVRTAGVVQYGYFDGYFFHSGVALSERDIPARRSRVELTHQPVAARPGLVQIQCSRGKFASLEREKLQVWRDSSDQNPETDLLSFVCLCARIGL